MVAGKGKWKEATTDQGPTPPPMTLFFLSWRTLEKGARQLGPRQQGALSCSPHWPSLLGSRFHATSPWSSAPVRRLLWSFSR